MPELIIALLMIVNGEIKEHRIQESMSDCLKGKRVAMRSNKNNNMLVNNLNIARDITKIAPIEKNMIIVGLIEKYLEIKNDKST